MNTLTKTLVGAALLAGSVLTVSAPASAHPTFRGEGVYGRSYDGYGRWRESRDPLGNATRTAYDDQGNPSRVQSFDGASGDKLSEAVLAYDLLHRRTAAIEKLWRYGGGTVRDLVTTSSYDAVGNVISTVDPLGRETTFGFDTAERLVQIADPAEHNRAKGPDGKTRGKGGKREDEGGGFVYAGKEFCRDVGGQQAVEIEVIPFEDRAQRGCGDDELFILRRPMMLGQRPFGLCRHTYPALACSLHPFRDRCMLRH